MRTKLPQGLEGESDWDITEENTTPETWGYLNRPEDEQDIPYEDWLLMYYNRLDDSLL